MQKIIQDLVSGKMNLRKAILWAFVVFLMVATGRAVWSVSSFVAENPAVLFGKEVAKEGG